MRSDSGQRRQNKNEKGKSTVLIVDEHPIVRHGLRALIGREPDLRVCGEAADAAEAMRVLEEKRPRLAIVNLSVSPNNGLELVKAMKEAAPKLLVLVLSMYDEAAYAERSLRAGARGYVMKADPPAKILEAVRTVLRGEVYAGAGFAARLLNRLSRGRSAEEGSPLDRLSDRQLQVLRTLGQGLSVREIARGMGLSVKTVETHREHVKQKLGIESSAELLRYAIRLTRVEGPRDSTPGEREAPGSVEPPIGERGRRRTRKEA